MTAAAVALKTGSRAPRRAPNVAAEVGSIWFLKYTPNTSYTTGGDSIDIAAALPYSVRGKPFLVQLVQNDTTAGWQGAYDATNKKVLLWNGTTQASNGTDYSAKVFDMVVWVP